MLEVLNDAERSALGAADAVNSLLDALRAHLKEVTSNTVAHVELERDASKQLQGAAMEAANRGMRFINACMRMNEEMQQLPQLTAQVKELGRKVDEFESQLNRLVPR
ncbi:hypothetical protein CLOP_g4090 [Closterium sp. NIES-67]|nr:hypothetical protein CLOP_g4090 [Closterium sp. NIES-67]